MSGSPGTADTGLMDDPVTRLQSDTPDVGVEPLTANRKTPFVSHEFYVGF